MKKGLVSVISPCYNGEIYVKRFLESILSQTYKNIELIIINDGSIDKTEEIILSYKNKFAENRINMTYIYQKNKGQAEAINQGLKIMQGEFLTWPDADDTLTNDSIEKKVEFLKKHQEFGYVRTMANCIDEKTNKIVGSLQPKNKKIKEYIFEDLIFENDVWYAPGCYMVKTEEFLAVNPKREIYASRNGQNWQMLLPIAYKCKCGYLPEKLYNYYIRENSHSHKDIKKIEIQLKKIDGYKDILVTVLSQMGLLEKYQKELDLKYIEKKFKLAFFLKNKELLKNEYKKLKKSKRLNFKIRIMYKIGKSELLSKLLIKGR